MPDHGWSFLDLQSLSMVRCTQVSLLAWHSLLDSISRGSLRNIRWTQWVHCGSKSKNRSTCEICRRSIRFLALALTLFSGFSPRRKLSMSLCERKRVFKPTFIAHFQKKWKTGARMGARSIMGSFGGSTCICFPLVRPQTIPQLNARPL